MVISLQAEKEADGVVMGVFGCVDSLPGVVAKGGVVSVRVTLDVAPRSDSFQGAIPVGGGMGYSDAFELVVYSCVVFVRVLVLVHIRCSS